ncbi:RND superfamily putative drug exporter [Streptosporangium becharense]|uniref:RND superfamily putative drug exporter n=1 Tax=Streptosporangium becharense TaxID=1816182 RepID=A0A7W9IDU9_9ACTN|nr:MMPL family transporter [Streptosporangium becharense]MBB2912340.1 RND superfamily putative drug exporter [Streptosporangium becharense]MBB5818887.1 RND superfamily putative drug exporter [Streptosporangium becharense]
MSGLLGRLGDWCARHGRAVLALWVIAAVLLTAGSVLFPGPVSNNVSIPGTDAQRAHDLMREGFGAGLDPGGTVQIVLYSPDGPLTAQRRVRAVHRAMDRIRQVPHVVEVETPYRVGGLAPSMEIGLITVKMEGHDNSKLAENTKRLSAAAEPVRRLGIEAVPADSSTPADKEIKTGASEAIGVVCALLVLLFAFGTLVAAMIPIFTALVSIATGLGVISLLGHIVDVPKQASIMATMIGLGVGIDYALFLLSRHRKLLADGVPVHEAVRRVVASSGGAVVFAGGTVVIALSALMLAGFPLLRTLGWITGISVVCAVLTSVTLVPALFGLLGHRVNALRLPFMGRRGSHGSSSGWASLGEWVARRPWGVLVLSVVVLGALTAPALALKLGSLDDGYADRGTDQRRSYELLHAGFGPGMNGPLVVVADLETRIVDREPEPAMLRILKERVADVDGMAHVADPILNDAGTAVLVRAVTDYAPSDPRALEVVEDVRALRIEGATVHVGGEVAAMADAGARISERTPLVVGVVVLLSALLLLLAFRSPVVAFKAALMNLVSLGAAFGALSLVFSMGLGSGLVGMDPPVGAESSYLSTLFFSVPIDTYIPLMLFAVLFGLSMDYEVFLLTAVRQSYVRHGDNRRAVAEGLGSTGRVITSAALIMVAVFVAFIAYPDPMVKIFGVGLAVAIAVDATIIRGFLVPAAMVLLGRFNWWCPAWLDRILPNLSIEGNDEEAEAEEPSRELVGAARG